MISKVLSAFARSIECVHLYEGAEKNSIAKSSCSYPELRSLRELPFESLSENAIVARIHRETEGLRDPSKLSHIEPLDVLCDDEEPFSLISNLVCKTDVARYHGLGSGSQNSSTSDLDQIVSRSKPKFNSYNDKGTKTGICYSTNYTQFERNLSLTELSASLYQQTSPGGKHSHSTSLPLRTCSSIISSYHHGAKKQRKVAFAKESPPLQNRSWRRSNRCEPSGQANGEVANSLHNLRSIGDFSGLSATKYRKMEPLFLPSVILLAWAMVIAAQMQHSTFDRGQNGIFPRDSQQSTLKQPLLHQPVVRHSGSRPDQFSISDTTSVQVNGNNDYCSAFQGMCDFFCDDSWGKSMMGVL